MMRRAILKMSAEYIAIGLGLEPGVAIIGVRDDGYGEIELLLDGGSLPESAELDPVPRISMIIETKMHPVFGGEYHEAHWSFSGEKRWPTPMFQSRRLKETVDG